MSKEDTSPQCMGKCFSLFPFWRFLLSLVRKEKQTSICTCHTLEEVSAKKVVSVCKPILKRGILSVLYLDPKGIFCWEGIDLQEQPPASLCMCSSPLECNWCGQDLALRSEGWTQPLPSMLLLRASSTPKCNGQKPSQRQVMVRNGVLSPERCVLLKMTIWCVLWNTVAWIFLSPGNQRGFFHSWSGGQSSETGASWSGHCFLQKCCGYMVGCCCPAV